MKSASLLRAVVLLGVALPHGASAAAEEGSAQERPVLAQTLSSNVLWTRRLDRYTLQVLTNFRTVPASKVAAPKPSTGARLELPHIEVWLLRKEGAAIPAYQRWQTPTQKASPAASRQPRAEVLYAYPLSEGGEAVAAVICTDGDCLVRKIAPFPQ